MTAGRNAARVFGHTLMGLLFASLLIGTIIFGQDMEAYVAPIVSETTPAADIYRDDRKACFTQHLVKNFGREAKPIKYEAYAEAHLSPELPLSIYVSDAGHEKHAEDLVNHDKGKPWPRTWCFELPATLADNQPFVVHIHAEHWRHAGWRSLSYFAPVRICGLKPEDPPLDLPRKVDAYCEAQRAGFR